MKRFLRKFPSSLVVFGGMMVSGQGCQNCQNPVETCLAPLTFYQAIVRVPIGQEKVANAAFDTAKLKLVATCPCNTELQLRESDTPIFGTPGDGDPPPPPAGTGGKALQRYGATPNYSVTVPEVPLPEGFFAKIQFDSTVFPNDGNRVVVGILDSGLNDKLPGVPLWTNPRPGAYGMPNDQHGADFSDLTPDGLLRGNFRNDETMHGTAVTAFVLHELKNLKSGRVEIMPLKVLGRNNQGTLFNTVCALEYARLQGAKVVNLSLGYYGWPESQLRGALERLQQAGVLVVAAAGNARGACDTEFEKNTAELRNLDKRQTKFFPASYSDSAPNLLSVTTLQDDANPCADQNFSPNLVNVGVVNDEACQFRIPYVTASTGPVLVGGSSYATPILTGQAVRMLLQGDPAISQREVLLQRFGASTELVPSPRPSRSGAVNGGWVTRKSP